MRILKYVLLLLLLGFIALTVFIATQKGEYTVTRTKFVKSPRATVFAYLNDFRNWDQWGFWKEEDPGAKFTVSPDPHGAGSFYQWKSDKNDGTIKTSFIVEDDSISQQMHFDGNSATYNWKLKDSAGGTVIKWHSKGKLRFMTKIQSAFKGGIEEVIGRNFEKSLANIDNNLDYEINTYTISSSVISQKPAVKYLKQTINSKISEQPRNLRIMLLKMRDFFQKNKLQSAGKPFVIYHSYNESPGITKFSVCMPITEEIFTSAGSDMQFGVLEPMSVVKSTLTGDYSHIQETWKKGESYVQKNNLRRISPVAIEVYTIGNDVSKQPSKWSTDVLIPIETTVKSDSTSSTIKVIKPTVKTLSQTNLVGKDSAH